MGRASRDKGARWELALLKYLRERRYLVMRSRQFKQGGSEEPDLLAAHVAAFPLLIECKDRKTLPAKGHIDALQQAEAAGDGLAVAIHKVARQPPGQAIVNLRLDQFLALLERASHGHERPDPTTCAAVPGIDAGASCSGEGQDVDQPRTPESRRRGEGSERPDR